MTLLRHFDNAAFLDQLKKHDYVVLEELSRHWSTSEQRKFLATASNVLTGLHNRKLVVSSLRLHWNDELLTFDDLYPDTSSNSTCPIPFTVVLKWF